MKDQNLSTPNLVIQCATVKASRSSEACIDHIEFELDCSVLLNWSVIEKQELNIWHIYIL